MATSFLLKICFATKQKTRLLESYLNKIYRISCSRCTENGRIAFQFFTGFSTEIPWLQFKVTLQKHCQL